MHLDVSNMVRVRLSHFYGIEIEEWPARIAETAMFLVDQQANHELAITFAGIETQTRKPLEILVVDSSRDDRARELCTQWAARIPVRYIFSTARSAAKQRNEGADLVNPSSSVIGFLDDDITLHPDTCEKILTVFQHDIDQKTGGISVRIDDIHRPAPRRSPRQLPHCPAHREMP